MATFARLPPTGIRVIVVGAGFGGLTAAIECDRKGHSVVVLEKFPELKPLGDIISFAANSGHIFQQWEGVPEALDPINHKSDGLVLMDWEGNFITKQTWEKEESYGKKFNGHRGQIHHTVFQHAKARGIDIRLGQRVEDYFETDNEAGVIVNGERMVGDVVVAAEGVRSRGRKIILGHEDPPEPSGYAVYRAWFPSDELAKNERTKDLVVNGDTHSGWIGPDVHFLVASIKNGTEVSWVLTHRDEADIRESWQFPGKVEDVLKCLEGWDPTTHDIVKATPADRLFDYKLMFRNPLPTFISPKARIVLIGDAAHPFLPTSIQGASQSMEDGAVLAVCLEKAGKSKVTEGVRAFEKIRYERVHRAQQLGVTTREQWHKADWEKIRKDPNSLHIKREPWLLDFDAETDAYARYDDVVREFGRNSDKVDTPTFDKPPDLANLVQQEVDQLA